MELGLSGAIGGMIAIALCTIISSKAARNSKKGSLSFGYFVMGLGWVCLFGTLGLIYVMLFTDHGGQYVALSCLIFGFGIGAVYVLGEAFKVSGQFDNESIQFHTPWTGSKNEKWEHLDNVKFNSNANWYTLVFKSGAKIRLSTLLRGHGFVIEHVKSLGHSL